MSRAQSSVVRNAFDNRCTTFSCATTRCGWRSRTRATSIGSDPFESLKRGTRADALRAYARALRTACDAWMASRALDAAPVHAVGFVIGAALDDAALE